jgi:predicted nucleotidyltransferase
MDDLALLISRALAAQSAGVVSAYLFGSHAGGRAHRESDVDVGILLGRQAYPTSRDRFDARLVLGGAIARSARSNRIDIVILNDAPPHLGRRIVTEGRRVFCADPDADLAFVRDVQLRAADLEPFLRRMQRLKLDALARP